MLTKFIHINIRRTCINGDVIDIIQDRQDFMYDYNYKRKDMIAALRNDCENTLNGKRQRQRQTENSIKEIPMNASNYMQRFLMQFILCILIVVATYCLSSSNILGSTFTKVNEVSCDSKGIHEAEEYLSKIAESVIHKD